GGDDRPRGQEVDVRRVVVGDLPVRKVDVTRSVVCELDEVVARRVDLVQDDIALPGDRGTNAIVDGTGGGRSCPVETVRRPEDQASVCAAAMRRDVARPRVAIDLGAEGSVDERRISSAEPKTELVEQEIAPRGD